MNRLAPILLVMLLTGCAEVPLLTLPTPADKGAWDLRQQALNKLNIWSITSHLAVQTGTEGWSATLHWVQDRQNFTMRFIAPLGQGTYQLAGDDQLVSLRTPDNRLYQANNPERLLQDNLGWNVPLHGLQ